MNGTTKFNMFELVFTSGFILKIFFCELNLPKNGIFSPEQET